MNTAESNIDMVDSAEGPNEAPRSTDGPINQGEGSAPQRRLVFFARDLTRSAIRAKWMMLALLLSLFVLSYFFESTPANGFIWCPFRRYTGLDCAGCGMTRSWVSIVHGEFSLAHGFNPFGMILFVGAVAKCVVNAVELRAGRELIIIPWVRTRKRILGILASALIIFGFYRLYVQLLL